MPDFDKAERELEKAKDAADRKEAYEALEHARNVKDAVDDANVPYQLINDFDTAIDDIAEQYRGSTFVNGEKLQDGVSLVEHVLDKVRSAH